MASGNEMASGGGGGALVAEYASEYAGFVKEGPSSALVCWDVGVLAWRLLQARGSVNHFAHTLSFEGGIVRLLEEQPRKTLQQ